MEKRDVSSTSTMVLRLCGHRSTGPRGVADQSRDHVSASSSLWFDSIVFVGATARGGKSPALRAALFERIGPNRTGAVQAEAGACPRTNACAAGDDATILNYETQPYRNDG